MLVCFWSLIISPKEGYFIEKEKRLENGKTLELPLIWKWKLLLSAEPYYKLYKIVTTLSKQRLKI